MDENYYKQIFSKNLRHYMDINQKSQIDLINDLGLNKSAVSTWCNGTRLPRMDKVDLLAKYFRIKRSDLIEERNPAADRKPTAPALTNEEIQVAIAYRAADDLSKAMVRRALSIEDEPAQESRRKAG